jgi:16S rRNA processing protein RimM
VTGVASGMSSTSSKTEPRTDLPETIAVGRVLGAHGLGGEVAVEVLSDEPRRFQRGSSLLLVRAGEAPAPVVVAERRGGPGAGPGGRSGKSGQSGRAGGSAPAGPGGRSAGTRREVALVRFTGCACREQAEAMRGAWLEVERSRVPPAPAGTYRHYELLGCRCVCGGEALGEVVEVAEDGGGLLLIVSDGRRVVPVPFVARFLRAIDVERGEIDLDLPPGLLETCASRS